MPKEEMEKELNVRMAQAKEELLAIIEKYEMHSALMLIGFDGQPTNGQEEHHEVGMSSFVRGCDYCVYGSIATFLSCLERTTLTTILDEVLRLVEAQGNIKETVN